MVAETIVEGLSQINLAIQGKKLRLEPQNLPQKSPMTFGIFALAGEVNFAHPRESVTVIEE